MHRSLSSSSELSIRDNTALHAYAHEQAENNYMVKLLRKHLICAEMWLPRKVAFDHLVNAIAHAFLYVAADMPKASEHRKDAWDDVKKCLEELGVSPNKRQIGELVDHLIDNWLN